MAGSTSQRLELLAPAAKPRRSSQLGLLLAFLTPRKSMSSTLTLQLFPLIFAYILFLSIRLHGSGTALGDSLELEALNLAKADLGFQGIWTVGSNKGNIGNCEASELQRKRRRGQADYWVKHQAASGLASLVKICKSLQHGFIPPMQDFEQPNPLIDPEAPFSFAAQPVVINRDCVFGISSSGYGGVNAHCVVTFPPSSMRLLSNNAASITPPISTVPSSMTPYNLATGTGSQADTAKTDLGGIVASVVSEASNVLGLSLEPETDLRSTGLSSFNQIRLVKKLQSSRPDLYLP